MTDELYKKSNPMPRPVYDPDTNKVVAPDNDQSESLESRDGPSKPATQVDTDIFTKGGNASVNMKTPDERGQTIRKRTAPVTWAEVHDQ